MASENSIRCRATKGAAAGDLLDGQASGFQQFCPVVMVAAGSLLAIASLRLASHWLPVWCPVLPASISGSGLLSASGGSKAAGALQ